MKYPGRCNARPTLKHHSGMRFDRNRTTNQEGEHMQRIIGPEDWPAEPTHPCSATPALQWAKWYKTRRAITALSKLAREYTCPTRFDDAALMVLAIIDNGNRIPQLPSGAFDCAMLASEVCHA